MSGRAAIISKGLVFSVNRDPKIFSDGIFKVNLEGLNSKQGVIERISEILTPNDPRPSEGSLIKGIA